ENQPVTPKITPTNFVFLLIQDENRGFISKHHYTGTNIQFSGIEKIPQFAAAKPPCLLVFPT
ncbi:MAG: hypothetical protein LH618_08060, partial [Saprospiraceae bacterium]|nr:hypothetical protein [Saprospiraceae bacterium]